MRLKNEVKCLGNEKKRNENSVVELKDLVSFLGGEIEDLEQTVKKLIIKCDKYEDIDTVIENLESKVNDMIHRKQDLDKITREI